MEGTSGKRPPVVRLRLSHVQPLGREELRNLHRGTTSDLGPRVRFGSASGAGSSPGADGAGSR